MARFASKPTLAALAAAACCGCPLSSHAQAQPAGTVIVTGRGLPATVSATGFDVPLARTPMQAGVYGQQQLADSGGRSIADLVRLDASLGDAYDAEGYWAIISARGYTLDNRANYRRDGLPINAETAIALDNKDRVEVLKGISGLQAGTSAPGGLVNLVTKRANSTVRSARIEARQAGTLLAAVDLADRFGADARFGLRLNAAAEHLDPRVRHTRGDRTLLALAGDAQLGADTLLQAEIEASHQRQPSVAGYSMLGNTVPDARRIDLLRNLNDQPWRQPVVLDGTTASVRLQQRLADGWTATAHALQQRLRSDDRTAFPYGLYDSATYSCTWCDRYGPDGSFTYWQFASDRERRTSRALSLSLAGSAHTAGVEHRVEGGVLLSRFRGRFQDQVFDIAGTGRIDGSLVTPPSPGGVDANTNRDERSTEVFLRVATQLGPAWQLWAGLRHTRLQRASIRTRPDDDDSLRATSYRQPFTAPWAALVRTLAPGTMGYVSWGQGVESDVAPNRSRYVNAGQPLPALKSRQYEVGIKHEGRQLDATLAAFDIRRPQAADIDIRPPQADGAGSCDAVDSCLHAIDGSARHRGADASAVWRSGRWTWQAGAMWLHARREGATAAPAVNGLRPVNVPRSTLRLGAETRIGDRADDDRAAVRTPAAQHLHGLTLLAQLSAESNRAVLPTDASVTIPGWARLDLGARWQQDIGDTALTWRVGLDNAAGRKAWKESPYQFDHVYLYALPPRTWRASVQAAF